MTTKATSRLAACAITTTLLVPLGAAAASAKDDDAPATTSQSTTGWSEEAMEYGGALANKDRAYDAYLENRSRWEQAAARVAAGDRTGTLPIRPARVVHVTDTRPWPLATMGFAGLLIGLLAAGLTGRVRRNRSRTARPRRIAPA
jgi:hypothetical protein